MLVKHLWAEHLGVLYHKEVATVLDLTDDRSVGNGKVGSPSSTVLFSGPYKALGFCLESRSL